MFMRLSLWAMVLREGEGAGGAGGAGLGAPGAVGDMKGGAGAGEGAAGGDGKGGAGGAGGAAGAGDWKLPDGVPDHLRGKDAAEFGAKLFEDWGKQRQALSKVPAAPKDVNEYVYQPSDKAKPFVGDLTKDPVFNVIKDAAFKAGVPKGVFETAIGGFYDALVEGKMLPEPYNPTKERQAFFGPEARGMTDAQMVEKLTPMLNEAQGFINALVTDKHIDQAGSRELLGLLDTANGAKALLGIQKLLAGKGLQLGGQGGGGGTTPEALRQRQADPRNDPNRHEYSRPFAEETQRLYQAHYK